MEDHGIIELTSPYSVPDTVDRLISALQSHKMEIFARIDQQAAAKRAGLEMPAMELIIFGNPTVGTPLMLKYPSIAIDLPLKLLVWEDAAGVVRVGYNSPEYLQERHLLPQRPFEAVGPWIEQAIA